MMNNNKERQTNTAFKIPTKIQYILSYFYIISMLVVLIIKIVKNGVRVEKELVALFLKS